MAPVGKYSKTGLSCWGRGLPKTDLPKTLKKWFIICFFINLFFCSPWKELFTNVWFMEGNGYSKWEVACSRLRDCGVHWIEKVRTRKWDGRKLGKGGGGRAYLSLPFSFFSRPGQLFACLSLLCLPHYLRDWNRLKGKRNQKLQLSLKVILKLNWNFQRDGGEGWGFKPKETCRRGTDWYYWSSTILQDLLLDTLIWLLSWLLFFVALFLGLSLEGLSALERHTCNSVI